MRDVMVDIETMGTCNDAVITQIGACYFDRYTGETGEEFQVNVEISSCLKKGLRVTSGSIKFWLERASNATFLKNPIAIGSALGKLGTFLNINKDKPFLWNHATFDAIVLASAYEAVGQGLPYSYRNVRDIRTLVDLSGIKYKKEEGKEDPKSHDALEDCLYQVKYCVECFKALRKM